MFLKNITNKCIIWDLICILNILIINCSNVVQPIIKEQELTTSLEYNLSPNQDNSYKLATPLPAHRKKRSHSGDSVTNYLCMLEAEQISPYQSCSGTQATPSITLNKNCTFNNSATSDHCVLKGDQLSEEGQKMIEGRKNIEANFKRYSC